MPFASVVVLITRAGAIVRVIVFVLVAGEVAESVTVRTTENVPFAVGVPEMIPVPAAIVKPAGKPVADQL